MPDTKRFTTIFDVIDRFTQPYENIKKKLAEIEGKVYSITFEADSGVANQVEGINGRIEDSYGKIGKSVEQTTRKTDEHKKKTEEVGNATQSMSSKVQNAFKGITDGVDKFHTSLTGAIQSLTAMAVGGGVAGFAWLDAAKAKLFEEQTERAIASNRKLKLSQQDVAAFTEKYQGAGWTTAGKMTETLQAASLYGAKYGFTGKKLEGLAASAEQVAFAKQESLGGMTGGELVRMSTQIKGKLRGDMEAQFRAATADVAGTAGYEGLIKTARGRLKLLQREAEKGGEGGTALNMQVELDKRPWAEAMNNVNDLKRSVGESLGGPMRTFTKMFSDLAKAIKNVPGGAAVLGWAAIFIAVAGGAGLLLNIMSPLGGAFKVVQAAMTAQKTVAATAAVTNTALAASEGGAATGAWAMASGLWAAIAPLLLIVVPLVALGALLYMVEQKTHIFSKALKELGKTQMAKDFWSFWKDVGYWIGVAIEYVDRLYKTLKAAGLQKFVVGAALGAIGIAGVAAGGLVGKKPEEILEIILERISGLLHWASATFPLFAKILEVLKKVQGIFEWLYSLVQNLYSGIRDVLGSTKAEKGKKLDEYATEKSYFFEKGPGGGWRMFEGSDSPPPATDRRFWRLKGDYEKAPAGLTWDGITEAVKRGLEGMKIPGMEDLTEAINALNMTMGGILNPDYGAMLNQGINPERGANTWTKGSLAKGGALDQWINRNIPYGSFLTGVPEEKIINNQTEGQFRAKLANQGKEQSEIDRLVKEAGYDVGAIFQKGGLFQGKVHAPEEIIPQATAARGPGPIAQAIELLDGIMSGKPVAAGAGRAPYTIQITNQNDFSGMKVSGDVDIERLLAKIDKRIESKSVEAVKRAIGQGRT